MAGFMAASWADHGRIMGGSWATVNDSDYHYQMGAEQKVLRTLAWPVKH